MPGLGLGAAASFRGRRRARRDISPITANVLPASSPLLVGQSLSDTQNWAVFTDPANFATSTAGESIASVVVNYIGDTANASEPFADGQRNSFSLTVTDTGGAVRLFSAIPRTVVYLPPLFQGPLADQSYFAGTGLQSYDVSGLFSGADLSFSINSIPGVLIESTTGVIGFETDLLPLVSGASVVVTAQNSGGSAFGSFTFDLLPTTVLTAEITGLASSAAYGAYAQIGIALTGGISGLQGDEILIHRWQDSGGVISGADTASYTPMTDQDLETLRYAPLVNGDVVTSPTYTVRYAPPIAGTLAPVIEVLGSGTPTVNLTAGFSGEGLSFSEFVSWAQVDGSVLTIDDALRDDIVTITATNSGGQASVDLSVTIAATPVTAPAQMAPPAIVTNGPTEMTVTLAADPDNGGAPIDTRSIRYSLDGTTWVLAGGITSPYVLSGLTAETEYFVQARVSNAVGTGPWSASAAVTTPAVATSGPVFNATRTGIDLTLANVPDVAAQSFTASLEGANLIVTFTGALETPAPRQLGLLAADYHDGTQPEAGSYTLDVLDLGTPVGNVYTVPVTDVPLGAMVILLAPEVDVVGGGLSEFKRVVFLGASIMEQTFGAGSIVRVPEVETLFADRGAAVEVYVHAVSGSGVSQIQTLLTEAMAAFPQDTLFFVHAGGNDVTDSRPYPGGAAALTASLEGLIDIAATRPGSVILSDLTFRDYDGATALDEAAGTKPYNDNIYLPLFQSRKSDLMERAYYDADGTPAVRLYEWSYTNRARFLSADNVHPSTPEGRALLRDWLAERLAPLCLGQPAPAQVDRVSLEPVTESVDLFIEYGTNTATGVNTPDFALATENTGQVSDGPFVLHNRDGSNPGVTLTLNFSAPAPGGPDGFGVNMQGRTVPVATFDDTLYNQTFTTDSYFVGAAYTVDHVISGLAPDAAYRVGFVASRAATGPRETRYSFSHGETATIETTSDPVSLPVFLNTRSDATGTITITQSAISGAWSYLGGLHIFDI